MNNAGTQPGHAGSIRRAEEAPKPSSIISDLGDFVIHSDIKTSLTYINFIILYICVVIMISGITVSYWWSLIYLPIIYILTSWRKALKEKMRQKISHRIPFFADALGNSLSVGANLEQAFNQATYYLKDEFKNQFDKLILKCQLGKDLGELLRKIDADFPGTGLRYLISLIEEYRELGVGISPLLKKMAEVLTVKEEAEEKIRTILAAGSGYARLSIMVFSALFASLTFFMRDQLLILMTPALQPTFLFLGSWTCVGIIIVMRITAMDFAKTRALRPHIKRFIEEKEWNIDTLMYYSGIKWPPMSREVLTYIPLVVAFAAAYIFSWYQGSMLIIFIVFVAAALIGKVIIDFILKGLVEDEMIAVIETFPELLQVFIIGLNSGLNTYLSFQLAQNSVKGTAPRFLVQELARANFAMECGESTTRTWQRLADVLPFETVIDFCEIMVVAPMHGESIVRSIVQMTNTYQVKKLTFIEKKAQNLGQLVIPLIVLAFFPLFLFAVFAPLLIKMAPLLNN